MFNLLHSKHYFIFIEGGAVLWAILIKMRRSPVILLGVRTRLWWKALWPGCLHWQHSSWLVLMLHQYSSSQRLEGKMLDLPGVATSKSYVYFWQSCSTLKSYKLFKFAQTCLLNWISIPERWFMITEKSTEPSACYSFTTIWHFNC